MKILFLDDNAERHKKFVMNRIGIPIDQAWTHADACRMLTETVYDVAYLDHDLSELAAAGMPAADEKTGTHVAEFIAAMPEDKRPKQVIIHSYNDYGRKRMLAILQEVGVSAWIIPFTG